MDTARGNIPNPTIEVAALFEIWAMFGQNGEISVIELHDENGKNSRRAIRRAYKYYREWFEQVKAIGLSKAREEKLNPLRGKDVWWDIVDARLVIGPVASLPSAPGKTWPVKIAM